MDLRDVVRRFATAEVLLFVLFNAVGLALGTLFRFWSYRRFVFAAPSGHPQPAIAPVALATRQR